MIVDKIISVVIETKYGNIEQECKISLEEIGNEYKASIDIDNAPTEIHNSHIFRKKDINKLPTGANSNLFKGMSEYDREMILEEIKSLESDLEERKNQQTYQINEMYAQKHNDIIEKGRDFYSFCKENGELPSNIIMKISKWRVADEEINVLKIVLAILSTMRGDAINIITEASAGSGKTIIEDTAFDMVHSHNYKIMNFATSASFKNACIDNPYMFKNKVIRFGDMGSSVAEEVMEEVKSIIKILNSEGYYSSSKMLGQENIVNIELIGHSSMCMSKVANERDIDSQDSSRGIIWTPALDNDVAFSEFSRWVNIKSESEKEYEEKIFMQIRDYMDFLASLDIMIINPYTDVLNELFKRNETYRRLFAKQDNILKMLALVNLPNKEIIFDDNGCRIYVSNQDFEMYYKLFYTTLIGYREFNVEEKDINLLESLKLSYVPISDNDVYDAFTEILDTNKSDFYDENFMFNDGFFTVNDIVEKMSNVRSVHNLIGNIKDTKNRKQVIRDSLKRLNKFIGVFIIPNDNWRNARNKPNLYYIKDTVTDEKVFNYYIDYRTIGLLDKYFGKDDIYMIIRDMKNNCDNFKITNNKIIGCVNNVKDKSIFDTDYVDEPIYVNNNKKIKDIIDINLFN